MDLELATTEDILEEFLKRQVRFVMLVIEDTNCSRPAQAYLSTKGVDQDDILELAALGIEMLGGDDSNAGGPDPPDL